MMNGSAQSQALQRMALMANTGARTLPAGQGTVQAKIKIGLHDYGYDDASGKLKVGGYTASPADKAKAKAWATDAWKRSYTDAKECVDHIDNKPVTCGLFRDMALWYRLPFKSGTPFVLGELHSTKAGPLMKESNRTGTLLNESHGVVPVGAKATADKGAQDGYKKTSMESAVAKTLFGVTMHTAASMEPKNFAAPRLENSDDWAWNYQGAALGKKGADAQGRLYYLDGKKRVMQDNPGAATGYNSLNSLERVVTNFDTEAKAYYAKPGVAKTDSDEIRAIHTKLNAWWTDMKAMKDLYVNKQPRDVLEASLDAQRTDLMADLKARFDKEYQGEKAAQVTPLGAPGQPKIGAFAERTAAATGVVPAELVDAMAMRDLAMITAITNAAATGWGDHEMIVMGDKHAQTQGPALRARLGLTVITRDQLAAAPYGTPAL
jgi:hypothetical protein